MSPANQTPQRPRKWRWLKISLVAVAGLLAAGSLYQQFGEADDLRKHPPAGVMVDAGGFKLHLNCTGAGSPTVIAEAGGSDFSIIWRHVQRVVSEQTRFCSYDRSGFGWSEYSGEIPIRQRVSADLRMVLHNGGITGPLVLLGHSLGGVYVRDYAFRYPEDVVGIVLVDSSHENQFLRAPEAIRRQQERGNKVMRVMTPVCSAVTSTGILRVTRFWHRMTSEMAEEARVAYATTRSRTEFCSALGDTLLAFDDILGLNEPPRSLGNVPLIVLSHGRSTADTPAEVEWEKTFGRLQEELAALSTDSQHRVIAGAGHMIPIDDPAAVIEAVLEMVGNARR